MSTSVTLPALGESVTEGTVSRWLKQVGDTVEADEPLLEVSTDKVDTEIPSPTSGVLLEIKAAEDETVEVGAVLAVIGEAERGPGRRQWRCRRRRRGRRGRGARRAEPSRRVRGPASRARAVVGAHREPDASRRSDAGRGDAGARPPGTAGRGGASGTEVTLPALGESVTEGTVSRWLKQVGDTVEADEPLLEVSTDKVDTEIPSPTSGTVLEIRVQEDETVAVGEVLAVVGEAGAAAPGAVPRAEAEPSPRPGWSPAPRGRSGRPGRRAGHRHGQRRHRDLRAAGRRRRGGQAPIPAPASARRPHRRPGRTPSPSSTDRAARPDRGDRWPATPTAGT